MGHENTIRVGIIGCGGIANGKHMPSLKQIPGVQMVAFCDIIEERAQKARQDYGTPDAAVYTDYRKLLEDKSIDVVHVCTPNRAHSFITVDALHAGKHVMCEKPMAINSEEAKKMLDAARETGKKLTIGYQSRQRADAQYMKNECLAGTFGEIYYAKATALRRRAVPTWGVFLNEYEQGGGPLIDIGTHSLDLTLYLLNNYKPRMVVGTTFKKLTNPDQANPWGPWDEKQHTMEDSAFGFIVMENGATIILKASWALNTSEPIPEGSVVICGSKAGAQIKGYEQNVTINKDEFGRLVDIVPDMKAGGAAFYDGVAETAPITEQRRWYQALYNNTDPVVLPEQACVVSEILEAIYTSAKTGQPYYFCDNE